MLRIAQPRKGNQNQVAYEKAFADKFELVKNAPNYAAIERFAQQCIDTHCGDSLQGISARVYMDKISLCLRRISSPGQRIFLPTQKCEVTI